MAIDAVTDLAIFSLVHVIMAAEAGAAAMEGSLQGSHRKNQAFHSNLLESAGSPFFFFFFTTIFGSFRFDSMFKPLAALAIILALLALVREQQHQLTPLPTAPMPAPLIP